jgi:hypothetical protein
MFLPQPTHPSALLIHTNEKRNGRGGLQGRCQLVHLRWRKDIAPAARKHIPIEKDHPADMKGLDIP